VPFRTAAATALALALCASHLGIAQDLPPNADRRQLLRDVQALSAPGFEGRAPATRGGIRARQYIVDQLRMIGVRPAGLQAYLQYIPGGAANVIGRLDGTDPLLPAIVVSAHYDHEGIKDGVLYPGADDNASGVAGLLAVARHFRQAPVLRHTLVLAAFDAEEDGLRGSRAFVAELAPRDRVAVNINLDMISRSDRGEIYAAGLTHYPMLRPMLTEVQMRARVKLLFGHDTRAAGQSRRDDWTMLSDHGSFHAARIPFVYFGVEDHPDYHRPSDTADKIDADFFGNVVDMVLDTVITLDAGLD
jgi:Zn-dependent M28 family amino/carboxypeptidase